MFPANNNVIANLEFFLSTICSNFGDLMLENIIF